MRREGAARAGSPAGTTAPWAGRRGLAAAGRSVGPKVAVGE